MIEVEIDSKEKAQELDEFEEWISKILYILNEGVHIRDENSTKEI